MPLVDFGVDFHTGGASRYNYPQIRFTKGDADSQELADMFAAPYSIEKGNIRGSLRKLARDMKIPFIVYEGGEALRFDGAAIEIGMDGLRRVMQKKGMVVGNLEPKYELKKLAKTSWIRAADSGLFLWYKGSGHKVLKGEPLGQVGEPFGNRRYIVRARREGYIIGHNNAPVVHQGDALFHMGYE